MENENELTQEQENDSTNTVVSGENEQDSENNEVNTTESEVKTFTQEQVNDIVRERLDKAHSRLFSRYDVKDRNGLDELVGKAQAYELMKEQYVGLQDENVNLTKKYAFLKNNINPSREEDINAYFKGKGMDFNEESLINELATHPEWLNVKKVDDTPKTTIKVLGSDTSVLGTTNVSEKEVAAKMFGLNGFKK